MSISNLRIDREEFGCKTYGRAKRHRRIDFTPLPAALNLSDQYQGAESSADISVGSVDEFSLRTSVIDRQLTVSTWKLEGPRITAIAAYLVKLPLEMSNPYVEADFAGQIPKTGRAEPFANHQLRNPFGLRSTLLIAHNWPHFDVSIAGQDLQAP